MKKKKFFGTDGIRGRVNKFPITEDFFFKLAILIKKTQENIKKVLIGRDTRISGKNIEKSLRDGFKKVNVDCDFVGIVSTPMISFYTKLFNYDFGVMISASHNPYYDNGIKNGIHKSYSYTGELIYLRNYIDGKLDGLEIEKVGWGTTEDWYLDSTYWKHGEKHGIKKSYRLKDCY